MHMSEHFFKGLAGLNEFRNELLKFDDLPGDCYKLMFTSNHDENSWNGTEYEKYGDAAKALAVLCCTYRAMPLIYSGQELPNIRRLKFFDKDVIEWKEEPALHQFYQTLLQERDQSNALKYGSVEMLHTSENDKVLGFIRRHEDQEVLVLLNLSSTEKLKLELKHEILKGSFESLFSGIAYEFMEEMEFELEAWGYLI
jgi:glycosidase